MSGLNRIQEQSPARAVKIDKGIPIPFGKGDCPALRMGVGDSVAYDTTVKARYMAGAWNARFKPQRFVSRKEGSGGRVWRVS